MTHRAKLRAYSVSILLCLHASAALAQTPEERAGARAAARSGVDAYNNGKYAESLDLFTRAEKLVHAPTHLLYIARNNLKLGRLVRAQEAYQQLAREKLGADAPKPFVEAQRAATQELEEFEARIPTVTVRLKGASDTSQVKVTIDGQPVPSALVGIPFPADPGPHRFAATAPGYDAKPIDKTLAESSRNDVELSLVSNGQSTTPTAAAGDAANADSSTIKTKTDTAQPPATEAKSSSSLRVPAYIALGVGAVGVVAGGYFAFQWNSKNSDADDLDAKCVKLDGDECRNVALQAQINTLDDEAYNAGTASLVAFAVGGVAVATGVTLLLLDGSSSKSPAALLQPSVHAYVGPGQLGLTGRF